MIPSTLHFSPTEVATASGGDVPDAYADNAAAMLDLLETVRALGGDVPLTLSSLYRAPAHNAEVGGANGSQHLTASAADFTPQGVGATEYARRILMAGLPTFGQLIIYPWTDNHIHLSLPNRVSGRVNETLVLVGNPEQYAVWDPTSDPPPWGSGSFSGATAEAPADEGGVTTTWVLLLVLAFLALGLGLKWWQ